MERNRDDEGQLHLLDPLRIHSFVNFVCNCMIPGVFLILCYLGTYDCGFSSTRPYMKAYGVCLRLKISSQSNSPWYLDLGTICETARFISERNERMEAHGQYE